MVVQLGHGADGRARGAHRVGLVDRDRRRNAIDRIHLRLVHAVEEVARVGAEGLYVAPLAFGVQRVEHERGLARARDPGDDDQLAGRDRQREVLEIVLARAANANRVGGRLLLLHGERMARRSAILSPVYCPLRTDVDPAGPPPIRSAAVTLVALMVSPQATTSILLSSACVMRLAALESIFNMSSPGPMATISTWASSLDRK